MYVLKKCPFCGRAGEIIYDDNDVYEYVPICTNENCIGHYIYHISFKTEEEAAQAWNRRYEECSNTKQ
jgi:hypothetical protein